jgi:hypothetical protein
VKNLGGKNITNLVVIIFVLRNQCLFFLARKEPSDVKIMQL